jgi:hypothetical protein
MWESGLVPAFVLTQRVKREINVNESELRKSNTERFFCE